MAQLFRDKPEYRLTDEEQQKLLQADDIRTEYRAWHKYKPIEFYSVSRIILIGLFIALVMGNVILFEKAFGKRSLDRICSRHTEQYRTFWYIPQCILDLTILP